MSRVYTLRKRADQQAETRRRIVHAAVALHGEVGPAQTPLSAVAERAGVQRHTLYAHFPDERSLLMACSSYVLERDPTPDASVWRGVADRRERLRIGLGDLYGWYERNADLLACVTRDAEHHAVVREVVELRHGRSMAAIRDALSEGLSGVQHALLGLALNFATWRNLTREGGLSRDAAAAAMVRAIEGAERTDAGAPPPFGELT